MCCVRFNSYPISVYLQCTLDEPLQPTLQGSPTLWTHHWLTGLLRKTTTTNNIQSQTLHGKCSTHYLKCVNNWHSHCIMTGPMQGFHQHPSICMQSSKFYHALSTLPCIVAHLRHWWIERWPSWFTCMLLTLYIFMVCARNTAQHLIRLKNKIVKRSLFQIIKMLSSKQLKAKNCGWKLLHEQRDKQKIYCGTQTIVDTIPN